MRLHFPNTTRAKKAAKRLAGALGVPLGRVHHALAQACGYRDWFEFEHQVAQGPLSTLDQQLTLEQFVDRQSHLIRSVSQSLSLPDSDVQCHLPIARLTGDRPVRLQEQVAIRLACWRATCLPLAARRETGAMGTLRSAGRNGEIVILRRFGRPTHVISDKALSFVGDFEYTSPRNPPPLFLPTRLYLPYGYDVETDGARVVFSRDYLPMWRLREGRRPERLNPWDSFETEDRYLLSDGLSTWNFDQLQALQQTFADEHQLQQLPVLADLLPILVHADPDIGPYPSDYVHLMRPKPLQQAA
ncbi:MULTISPECIES: hypothetical protein [unclassified Bosea (in: a-proteobacteria)]|jgi:hypothetical protein|uniref:hypothetical protein n=1 Tax=unclassified Bosea (in: a-proteobacteria) TaxID=2653178 RepID=UPI00125F14E0|nr:MULTISPECIES: hypothetical protein [unclassified Bosea (in: a-proteobacteria)]